MKKERERKVVILMSAMCTGCVRTHRRYYYWYNLVLIAKTLSCFIRLGSYLAGGSRRTLLKSNSCSTNVI